jgi:hypothetical protein
LIPSREKSKRARQIHSVRDLRTSLKLVNNDSPLTNG